MPPAAATPPDGGYGYLVMVTSWCSQFLVGTMMVGFATLMVDLVESFQTSQATAALTGALFLGTMNFCAILIGGLVHQFGSRSVCMVGAVLSTISAVWTSFATDIHSTYVSYGILGGLGASAVYLSSVVILQQYFDRNRAVTSGIASTGMSVGALLVGPAYRVLIDRFGWRMTMMLHGGLMLQGAVLGATYRPVRQTQEEIAGVPHWRTICSRLVDWRLLHDIDHVLFLIGGLLWQYGFATMYNLGPSRAVSQGMDKFLASMIPSTIAICSVVSRFVSSFVGNMKCTSVILQFSILSTCSGVVICLSCVTASFYGSLIWAGLCGICMGGFAAVMSTVSVELVGIENVSRAQGMQWAFLGFPSLLAMPIGGRIFDKTSNYNISFMSSGILTIAGGLCTFVVFFLRQRRAKGRMVDDSVEKVFEDVVVVHVEKKESMEA